MTSTWDSPPTGPARGPRRWAVVAGVIGAVLVIVIAAVLVLEGHRSRTPKVATPAGITTPGPAAVSTAAITPSASSPVSLPASRNAQTPAVVPTAPLSGVTWALFQGVALASSPIDGPSKVAGPVYAGYSHTPDGALLALNQISVRYLLTPGDGWRQVVERQVLPGAGRDAYTANRAKVTTLSGTKFGQTAGFRFVTYSPDVAVMQLVTSFSTHYQVATCTVRWVDGDWHLELQPDGGVSPTAQAVDSLAGFTAWSGVS